MNFYLPSRCRRNEYDDQGRCYSVFMFRDVIAFLHEQLSYQPHTCRCCLNAYNIMKLCTWAMINFLENQIEKDAILDNDIRRQAIQNQVQLFFDKMSTDCIQYCPSCKVKVLQRGYCNVEDLERGIFEGISSSYQEQFDTNCEREIDAKCYGERLFNFDEEEGERDDIHELLNSLDTDVVDYLDSYDKIDVYEDIDDIFE